MELRVRTEGLRRERVRASPQLVDGVFANPTGIGPGLQGNPLPLIGEYFGGGVARVPSGALPLVRPHETWQREAQPSSGFRTTWLGHSTVLLEIDGHRVLTDPVFGERASPVQFAGPKRFHPVPARVDELPALDVIVLSHDHYDHLCRSTWLELATGAHRDVPVVTALGVGAHLESIGVDPARITELDWNESVDVKGLRITATPAQHFSGRGPLDRNKTLWASWVIQGDKHKAFFSGDTGLTPQFEDIARAHGPFDLVMLEVGAWHPAWGGIHLGPENALTAFEMLGGGDKNPRSTFLPVHWGTFNLALHAWHEPAETLYVRAAERKRRVLTPLLGAPFELAHVDEPKPWWRALI